MLNLALTNKPWWNLNQNAVIFCHKNAFGNYVCKMAAISSRLQCVNWTNGKFQEWNPKHTLIKLQRLYKNFSYKKTIEKCCFWVVRHFVEASVNAVSGARSGDDVALVLGFVVSTFIFRCAAHYLLPHTWLTHWCLGECLWSWISDFQTYGKDRYLQMFLTDDKSTLVQLMAWCHQTPSHYLIQCWLSYMWPHGINRPQWVNHCCLVI